MAGGLQGAVCGSLGWSQEGGRLCLWLFWDVKEPIFSMSACVGLPFRFAPETVDKNREKEEMGILEQWPLLA